MKVLSVTSELFPLIKTGGLADVAGALPGALAGEGIAMRTLLPGYPAVVAALDETRTVAEIDDLMGGAARLLAADGVASDRVQGDRVKGDRVQGGLDLYVLDAPHLYDRPGDPYRGPDGGDWPDNPQRFAALAWVAAEIGLGLLEGTAGGDWRPDVVHGHDWQAGLMPAYLALAGEARPATVFTVHNIAFQGQVPATMLAELRLPARAYAVDGVEYYGAIGMLKAGLYYADRLTTVSPTYAREILGPEFGMGLDGLLRDRALDLEGIVNGIDEEVWNPATDLHLPCRYDATTLDRRAENKAALQARLGLDGDPEAPLFCVVTRLSWQKGMDLLLDRLPHLLGRGGQLAVLGAGDAGLEAGFAAAAAAHPGRIGCVFGYDESLSHLMQGGADAILVPSRFEPCGLTQLCGLRYGCVPVVARTGGLADTVIDANDAALADGVATGIQFAPTTGEALEAAIDRTIRLHRTVGDRRALQRRGMAHEVGWRRPAARYAALYRAALEAVRA